MQLLESIKVTTSITFRRAIIQVQLYNWELKQRRFWATHVNRKWAFSLFICLDAKKFVLLSFFALVKTIYRNVWTKPLLNDAKRPLPVDVHRSKTLLLNLPIIDNYKELVMPNTVAQNVGQSNVLFLDETRPEIFRQEGNNDSNLGETRSMQFE